MTEETQALVAQAVTWVCHHFNPESGADCRALHKGDHDLWCSSCIVLDLAAALTALSRDLETARQERDAALAEIAETRRVLWLAHRHKGIYGDDGEMQCGECAGNPPGERGMDYKRDPLPLSAISAARSLQRQTDAAVRAARAETDERMTVLSLLLEHGSWYISAIELDTRHVDGEELRDRIERAARERQ